MFHLHRQQGDDGGRRLLELGKECMDRMELEHWTNTSPTVFENKFFLMKAEYTACTQRECNEALELYQDSIKVSQDHKNIHEMGLAIGIGI